MLVELRTQKQIIEEIILFIILTLSFVGMAITDFSPAEGHNYWTILIIFLAFCSIVLGWSRTEYQGKKIKELMIRQLIHWGATLMTVSGVYLLLKTGRLNFESAGLVIELIIGLALFLDGRNLGWRCSLVGILVGSTAVIAAYVEEYVWVLLGFSLGLFVLTFIIEQYRRNRRQGQYHDK